MEDFRSSRLLPVGTSRSIQRLYKLSALRERQERCVSGCGARAQSTFTHEDSL